MIGRRSIIGLSLMCALLFSAVIAQGASASGKGQTIFECSTAASPKGFSDAHCDKAVETGTFGDVAFPETSTAITLTNGATAEETKKATTAVLKIKSLHGFSNVEISCTNVEGTGTALNSKSGEFMKGSGTGSIKFNNGAGVNCSTNQAGCTAEVKPVEAEAETVEGELEGAGKGNGMGLKFKPKSPAVVFTTVTFVGTCGLRLFPNLAVAGSAIATAGGEPQGHGATAWFVEGAMNELTIGEQPAQLIGKATLKRTSTGNALDLTTSP